MIETDLEKIRRFQILDLEYQNRLLSVFLKKTINYIENMDGLWIDKNKDFISFWENDSSIKCHPSLMFSWWKENKVNIT